MNKSAHIALLAALVVVAAGIGCASKRNKLDGFSPEKINVVRQYQESVELARFDELLESYGQNKKLPEGFELQALLALSHYPELSNVKINFIIDDVGIPISSRPHWASMARSAGKRTYQVIIDTQRDGGRETLLLKNQPFNAQVGIIGHELSHSVYYLDRSLIGIVGDALCQLSDCRIEFERNTDRRLIDYGLGWQRFDHSSFVRGQMATGVVRNQVATGAYMSPFQLLQLMQENSAYDETMTLHPIVYAGD